MFPVWIRGGTELWHDDHYFCFCCILSGGVYSYLSPLCSVLFFQGRFWRDLVDFLGLFFLQRIPGLLCCSPPLNRGIPRDGSTGPKTRAPGGSSPRPHSPTFSPPNRVARLISNQFSPVNGVYHLTCPVESSDLPLRRAPECDYVTVDA